MIAFFARPPRVVAAHKPWSTSTPGMDNYSGLDNHSHNNRRYALPRSRGSYCTTHSQRRKPLSGPRRDSCGSRGARCPPSLRNGHNALTCTCPSPTKRRTSSRAVAPVRCPWVLSSAKFVIPRSEPNTRLIACCDT